MHTSTLPTMLATGPCSACGSRGEGGAPARTSSPKCATTKLGRAAARGPLGKGIRQQAGQRATRDKSKIRSECCSTAMFCSQRLLSALKKNCANCTAAERVVSAAVTTLWHRCTQPAVQIHDAIQGVARQHHHRRSEARAGLTLLTLACAALSTFPARLRTCPPAPPSPAPDAALRCRHKRSGSARAAAVGTEQRHTTVRQPRSSIGPATGGRGPERSPLSPPCMWTVPDRRSHYGGHATQARHQG